MKKKIYPINLIIIVCIFFYSQISYTQDIQLTQYYNTSPFLNPAFTGSSYALRTTLDTRIQWPNLESKYVTYFASMDYNLETLNSGVGAYLAVDHQGDRIIKSSELAIQYAAWVNLTRKLSLRLGIQLANHQKSLDYEKLTFPSQYNPDLFVHEPIVFPSRVQDIQNVNFLDVSSGLLLYSDKLWIGYSAYHLNTPKSISYLNAGDNTLDIRHSFMAGYRFDFNVGQRENLHEYNSHIYPTFLYKSQGKSDQLDIGLYYQYRKIMVGTWYRGIPLKNYDHDVKNINHESLILLLGVNVANVSVAYSYDITVSKLARFSYGAHEISIIFTYPPGSKFTSKNEKFKAIPCPKFQRVPGSKKKPMPLDE